MECAVDWVPKIFTGHAGYYPEPKFEFLLTIDITLGLLEDVSGTLEFKVDAAKSSAGQAKAD
jgi:hypothetical protein